MLGLWQMESYTNPTLPPTDTQVLSREQPLQPYLPPSSLRLRCVPADTQDISCHSSAARGSTLLRGPTGTHEGGDARHRASHHAQRVPTFTGSEARSAGAS